MESEERDRQIERKQRQRWVAEIEKEYCSLTADEAVIHSKDLQKQILANWREHSPNMWANLRKESPSFPDKLAYVLQERMWRRSKELREGGMLYTDAQEEAEKEILMLEPEVNRDEITLERANRILAKYGMTVEDCPSAILDQVMDWARDW